MKSLLATALTLGLLGTLAPASAVSFHDSHEVPPAQKIVPGHVFTRLPEPARVMGESLELQSRPRTSEVEAVTKPEAKPAPVAVKGRSTTSRLAQYDWAVYKGPAEMAWEPYVRAKGKEKKLLGRIAHAPKAKWFGSWISPSDIGSKTRDYIKSAQGGDKNKLVQMTIFRMDPWYQESKTRQPSKKEIRAYKTWVRRSAAAIGNTPTALVLQPDLTFLRTVPNFKLSSSLISFAAKQYGALPNTLVYLESGAADWPAEGQGGAPEAVRLLTAAGIKYADGIATNTTHYSPTSNEVRRVAKIIELLKKKGLGQHYKAVINTSSNGQGFDFGKYQGPDPDDAWVCRKKNDSRTCVALGIPPTSAVGAKRWGLSPEVRTLARKYVDGYLWIGRPWLKRQNSPFLKDKALTLVRVWQYR